MSLIPVVPFQIALACGAAKSVHVTVVDDHGDGKQIDTATLMEIENLRRASLAELRAKYREVIQEETRSRHREQVAIGGRMTEILFFGKAPGLAARNQPL